MSFLKYFDIFGSLISFQYKTQTNFTTTFGGILSLLYFMIIVGCFYLIGRDFFSRRKPYITSSTEYSPSMLLSKQDFAIKFAYENYTSFENSRIIYFKLWENIVIDDVLEDYVAYDLVRCNETQFNSHYGGLRDSSSYFCLPKDIILSNYINKDDNNRKIQRYAQIYVVQCVENQINYFTEEECLTENEQSEIINLKDLSFTFFLPNINTDINKYNNEEAIISTLQEDYFYLTENIAKFVYYDISIFQIDSDYGWIFESLNSIKKIGIAKYNYNSITRDDSYIGEEVRYNLGGIYLNYSGQIVKQSREYIKIQNLFSDIGGLLEIFTVIFSFMANTYSSLLIKLELFNSYLDIRDDIKCVNNIISDIKKKPEVIDNKEVTQIKMNNNKSIDKKDKNLDQASNMDLFDEKEPNSNNLRNKIKSNSDKLISIVEKKYDDMKISFKNDTKEIKEIDIKERKVLQNFYKKLSVLDLKTDLNLKNAKSISFFEPIKMYFTSEIPIIKYICNSCNSRKIYDKIKIEYNSYVDINRYIKMREMFEKTV